MNAIICACCHRDLICRESVLTLEACLAGAGYSVEIVPDLCAAVNDGGDLVSRFGMDDETAIVACHPRAVRALFEAAGVTLPSSVRLLDLRAKRPAELLSELGVGVSCAAEGSESGGPEVEGESHDAWFPVIDRARCRDCGVCHNFCLFGVYSRDGDGRVVVANPSNCKNNCPACARVCPDNAIIFPKSPDEAINGADLTEEALAGAQIRLDPEGLTRGDIYSKLRARLDQRRKRRLLKPEVRPRSDGTDK